MPTVHLILSCPSPLEFGFEGSSQLIQSPDSMARTALDHYEQMPTKGKTKENEWTVYAAVVATSSSSSSITIVDGW
jgi:hypothetical protein